MNKILFSLVFAILALPQLSAQPFKKQLESTVDILWDDSAQAWSDTFIITTYNWNTDGSLKELFARDASGAYKGYVKYLDYISTDEELIFDIENGALIKSWSTKLAPFLEGVLPTVIENGTIDSTGNLVPKQEIKYSFTDQGQLTEIVKSQWETEQWQPRERILILYDTKGNYAGYTSYEWNTSWQPYNGLRYIYTYNTAGYVTEVRQQSLFSGVWRDGYKEIYELHTDGSVKGYKTYATWGHNEWIRGYTCKNVTWENFAPKHTSITTLYEGEYIFVGGSDFKTLEMYEDSAATQLYVSIVKQYDNGRIISKSVDEKYYDEEYSWDYYPNGDLKLYKFIEQEKGIWETTDSNSYSYVYDTEKDPQEKIMYKMHKVGQYTYITNTKTVFNYSNYTSASNLKAHNIKLYPNPCADVLNLDLDKKSGSTTQLTITDLTGRVVLSQNLMGQRTAVDVSKFQPGCYLLRLESGREIKHSQFIKY